MKVYPLHITDEIEYDGMMTNGVYLHGKAQDDNDFDLCWIPFFGCVPPYRTGKYIDQFEVTINGNIHKVNVYVWGGKRDDSEVMKAVKELDELFNDFKDKTNLWKARQLVTTIMADKTDLQRISEGFHGLVVYADDKEAVEYAEAAYKAKPNHI